MRIEGVLDTRRPRLLLTLLCLALWTPGFFTLPPGDRDESRFVQASKQMIETGDYVRIMNGTEPRNRKPIGIYWLQVPFAATAQATGLATVNPVWPYRIPSMLGAWVAVLACFGFGKGIVGRRAALLAAGMLAACALLVTEAHIAKTDAALLGATTVAMGVLARAYLDPRRLSAGMAAAFWLAVGAGVLLKGPITPMVAGLAALALVVADRRAGWLRGLRAGWGVPLMLLVVLPWFVAIGVATEGRFFADAVGGDLARKLASGDDAHWGPPGLHLLLLPILLFPATAALPGAIVLAWQERRTPAVRMLLAWIVPAWLVFEAVPTKLPHYTLPLYPAVCLLLAYAVLSGVGTRSARSGAVLAVAVAALLAGAGVVAPVLLHLSPWLGAAALVAAVVVGGAAMRGWAPRGAVAATVLAPLVYAAMLGWELPRLWPLWLSPRVVELLPPGRPVGAVGYSEPSLMMLAGTDTRWLLAADGAAALRAGTVAALVVSDRDLPAVLAALAGEAGGEGRFDRVEVPGYNYSRGRPVVLTVLSPRK